MALFNKQDAERRAKREKNEGRTRARGAREAGPEYANSTADQSSVSNTADGDIGKSGILANTVRLRELALEATSPSQRIDQ